MGVVASSSVSVSVRAAVTAASMPAWGKSWPSRGCHRKGSRGLRECVRVRAVVTIERVCQLRVVVAAASTSSARRQSWRPRRVCQRKGSSRGHRKHVSARTVVAAASMSVRGQSWSPRGGELSHSHSQACKLNTKRTDKNYTNTPHMCMYITKTRYEANSVM